MEGICEIEEIDREEWVVFDEEFNEELTPDILEFLLKYQKVKFGDNFDQPVDIFNKKLPAITKNNRSKQRFKAKRRTNRQRLMRKTLYTIKLINSS